MINKLFSFFAPPFASSLSASPICCENIKTCRLLNKAIHVKVCGERPRHTLVWAGHLACAATINYMLIMLYKNKTQKPKKSLVGHHQRSVVSSVVTRAKLILNERSGLQLGGAKSCWSAQSSESVRKCQLVTPAWVGLTAGAPWTVPS